MVAMRTISLKLSMSTVERIEQLVRSGVYLSRSQFVRIAVRDLLKRKKPNYIEKDLIAKMSQLITFKIPEILLKKLDKLKENGTYPSRSRAVRSAILTLLERESL